MHDLVIRNGTVVDGTGAPSRVADVAIDDGRVSVVGDVPDTGQEEIDAIVRTEVGNAQRDCSSPPASSTSTPTTTGRSCGTPS